MKTEDDLIEKNCNNCKYLIVQFKKEHRALMFSCKNFPIILNLGNPPCKGIDWEEEEIL